MAIFLNLRVEPSRLLATSIFYYSTLLLYSTTLLYYSTLLLYSTTLLIFLYHIVATASCITPVIPTLFIFRLTIYYMPKVDFIQHGVDTIQTNSKSTVYTSVFTINQGLTVLRCLQVGSTVYNCQLPDIRRRFPTLDSHRIIVTTGKKVAAKGAYS